MASFIHIATFALQKINIVNGIFNMMTCSLQQNYSRTQL